MKLRYFCLGLLIFLCSCGAMVANNGVSVTGQTVVGFRTTETEAQKEEERLAAYEAGKADVEIPEVEEVDDGSIEVLSPEEAKEIGGSLLGPLSPYWQLISGLGLIAASVIATKRKKGK